MGARKLATVAAAGIVVVLAARYWWWSDARDVRNRVAAIAAAASTTRSETQAQKDARAAQLAAYLTDDVIIRTDSSAFVGGRPAVVRFVMNGAAARSPIAVSTADVEVERIDASTVTVFLTLNFSDDHGPAIDPAPRQVHATFSKAGGEWRLSRGEVLRTLEASK
jgi:hypothetical protein